MSGILKLGGTTLGTENNGTIDLEFHSTSQDFTLKAVDAPIVGANYSTVDNLDSGQLAIYNGTTKLWGINESGYVVKPKNPAVFLRKTSNQNSLASGAKTKIIFQTAENDIDNNWDAVNSKFTAPIDGYYFLQCHAYVYSVTSAEVYIYINGIEKTRVVNVVAATTVNPNSSSVSTCKFLNAGDYVEFYAYGGGATHSIYWGTTDVPSTHASIFLIG